MNEYSVSKQSWLYILSIRQRIRNGFTRYSTESAFEPVLVDEHNSGHQDKSMSGRADTHVSVVGMGYVGLTLVINLDRAGYETVGYDIDDRKLEALQRGYDPIGEFSDEAIAASGTTFSSEPERIEQSDYVQVALPSPIDETMTPDLSVLKSACETIGRYISDGTIVVIESTLYPGATREELRPALERGAEKQGGARFSLGYSPERIVPGSEKEFTETIKIVSAETERTLEALHGLYDSIIDAGVYMADSIETAEAAKCLENVQRDVNIGLINEFTLACRHLDMDLDPHAVLAAATTKWNFHNYKPGIVGGHCIPVDPHYLRYKFEQSGFSPDVLKSARAVNEKIVEHVSSLTVDALRSTHRGRQVVGGMTTESGSTQGDGRSFDDVAGSRVVLLGFGYKPNTTDLRNSGVEKIADEFDELGLDVSAYDPFHDADSVPDSYDFEVTSRLAFDGVDAAVVLTPHDEFRDFHLGAVAERMNDNPVLVDVGNVYDREEAETHGFTYRRL